jgi:hypothetical protein
MEKTPETILDEVAGCVIPLAEQEELHATRDTLE